MLTMKPVEQNQIEKFYDEHNQPMESGGQAITAYEGEKLLGAVFFSLTDNECLIRRIDYNQDKWVCDGLLRAALNFAANRNILIAQLGQDTPKNVFVELEYIKDDTETEINIYKFFNSCKNCHKF